MTPAWSLVYESYVPEQEGLRESLCALGNGYFVSRGAAPDAPADGTHYPGTYLAGGYDRLTTEIAGHRIENEDLVNLPNWLSLTIRIDDGPWLHPADVTYRDYRQELDLRAGVLIRTLRFEDAKGRVTRWAERRLVSMAAPHIAALSLSITPENWRGRLGLRSAIDGSVINGGVARYRQLSSRHLETIGTSSPEPGLVCLRSRMVQSRCETAFAARTRIASDGGGAPAAWQVVDLPDQAAVETAIEADAGRRYDVEKVVALHTSRDKAISEPGLDAIDAARRAPGFEALLAAHRLAWRHLWDECGVEIDTNAQGQTQMKLRLHIFHLLQTVSPNSVDLDIGVPPRGWHGEAYRGHIMWDELFIFPFLDLRIPVLARALLMYRYRRLPEARRLAREAGFRGAMYPWQSGSNGREESQKIHLNPMSGNWIADNSYRQRHISAAIAYNVWKYYQVTGDREFLCCYGAELLIETTRFWASIARYNDAIDRYEIHGVMGPDEFHTAYPGVDASTHGGLNNNAYTNVMVSWSIAAHARRPLILPPARRLQLLAVLGIEERELEHGTMSVASCGCRSMATASSVSSTPTAISRNSTGRISPPLRRRPPSRSHPRKRGRSPEPLQGVETGRCAHAVLPVYGGRTRADFRSTGISFRFARIRAMSPIIWIDVPWLDAELDRSLLGAGAQQQGAVLDLALPGP